MALGNLSAAEVPIPLTEDYLPAGRVSAYLEDAQDFLRKNPKDPYAPRLTQDLLMVAKATGKDKIAEEARRSLLFRYVNSLQAGHLLTSLGSDPKALRGFLLQEADRVDEAEPDFPARFCRCVLTAVRRTGPKLLEDNAFRLRLLLLAEAAGVPNLPAFIDQDVRDKLAEAWLESQRDLVRLSSAGIHIIAEESGHCVQCDQPDLVADAIRALAEALPK